MDYLVNMTTHVPDGTSDDDVAAMRAREAARAGELAAEGHLLRLWRPPLQPGEWRTLGLFAAEDDAELENALASMPLRAWRTDEPTPLSPHANDPVATGADLSPQPRAGAEFLTRFTLVVPDGTPPARARDGFAGEARRSRELAEQGHLERLWVLPTEPGGSRSLGLWRATDDDELQAILRSLPLDAWMTVDTTPLTRHPSDPETRRR